MEFRQIAIRPCAESFFKKTNPIIIIRTNNSAVIETVLMCFCIIFLYRLIIYTMKMTMNANIPARDSDMTRAVPTMNKQAKPMYFIVLDLFSNGKQNGMLEAMQAAKPAGLSKLPEILKLVLQ